MHLGKAHNGTEKIEHPLPPGHSPGVARQAAGQSPGYVQLVSATTTETGLKVCCEIDSNLYPKGVNVTDQEMQAIRIARDEFHGEWNYTISPNQQPP